MKIGLIAGTSVNGSEVFASWDRCSEKTAYGEVVYRRKGGMIALNRHGAEGRTPPHSINHRANIGFLREAGVEEVVSVNSVGSLRPDLSPGTLVSCGDYVSFRPATFEDTELRSLTPTLANKLLPAISRASPFPIEEGKIYIQTRGPRFETRAEIAVIRHWGDVVGMTLASEADLCAEAGIGCNSLAMVDNYANGLTEIPLSNALFKRQVAENQEKVDRMLAVLAELLG